MEPTIVLAGLLVAGFATIVALVATIVIRRDVRADYSLKDVSLRQWVASVGFGVAILVGWLSVGFEIPFVLGLSALMAVVVFGVRTDADKWHELIAPGVLLVLLLVAAEKAAFKIDVPFWGSLLRMLPVLACTAASAFLAGGTARDRYVDGRARARRLDDGARRRNRNYFRLIVVVAVIVALLTLWRGVAWAELPQALGASVTDATTEKFETENTDAVVDDDEEETSEAVEADEERASYEEYETARGTQQAKVDGSLVPWVHYYNLDLQTDKDKTNDYNFGQNPWGKGLTPAQADKEFRERLKEDTALAAASTAWLDANVGTCYLGEFYQSCKNDWAKTINQAAYGFATDQNAYYENLYAFFAYLDSAVQVSVRDCHDVTDQMYMNPHTKSGVPDVIVYRTSDHSGHELVYTFSIKGNIVEVAYRIECGYQPCNVAEVMNITPQENPVVSGGGNHGGGGNPGGGDNPGGGGNPGGKGDDPGNGKDSSKLTGENTEKDDNTGPGQDKNNPENPNYSTDDRTDNSTSSGSYENYSSEVGGLAGTNQTQQTGGDDFTTPVSEPARTSDGQTISNTENNPSTAWGNGEDPV